MTRSGQLAELDAKISELKGQCASYIDAVSGSSGMTIDRLAELESTVTELVTDPSDFVKLDDSYLRMVAAMALAGVHAMALRITSKEWAKLGE